VYVIASFDDGWCKASFVNGEGVEMVGALPLACLDPLLY
jgi:hypothetical protein